MHCLCLAYQILRVHSGHYIQNLKDSGVVDNLHLHDLRMKENECVMELWDFGFNALPFRI